MRAQILSEVADSESALAPLVGEFLIVSSDLHRDEASAPISLDGVGITPQPDDAPNASITELDRSQDSGVPLLFIRAYALVSAALLLSAFVSTQVPAPEPDEILTHHVTSQFLIFFEIACVALLSRYVEKLPRNLAAAVLFIVAAVNGASFAVFLQWVSQGALAYGFLMCGVAFATTVAIAVKQKIDLSSSRGIGLLFATGLLLIGLVTGVLRLGSDFWGTALTGFVLFATLASYFCDEIASLDDEFDDDHSGWKSAICGALILYLNFINLYLILSRLFQWTLSRRTED